LIYILPIHKKININKLPQYWAAPNFNYAKYDKKKRDLLKYFGSSDQIKLAQLNEIEKVKGINKNIAKKIYNFFHEN